MSIREKGYHHWDGELLVPRFRWLPIYLNGIKAVIQKKYAKGLLFFTVMPFVIYLIGIYISTKPELNMLFQLVSLLKSEPAFFKSFATNDFLTFMLVIMGIFLGSDLISGDIKCNSFPLYFSRPLDRMDYIYGKMSILLFYFLMLTLVPNLLLYILKFIFTGTVSIDPQLLLGLMVTPIVITFVLASLTLMLSSFSGNNRYIKIIFFVLYFLSDLLGQVLYEIFKIPYLQLVSIKSNIDQMGAFLFNTTPKYDFPAVLSLLMMVIVGAGSFYILYKRIGRAEAQIETSN